MRINSEFKVILICCAVTAPYTYDLGLKRSKFAVDSYSEVTANKIHLNFLVPVNLIRCAPTPAYEQRLNHLTWLMRLRIPHYSGISIR